MYQINSYLSSVGVDEVFCRIRKNLKFLNLKLNSRLRTKKMQKLDDAFREEGKRFKSQIRLIIISRDC